ncbi:MAG: alpha/beta fold hydrolase [Saprospiraceae bacterium]
MTQTVQYKHYKIKYYLEGQGDLLLFLHGWPVNASLWQDQVEIFKKTHRVLTFDWLGFGASDHPIDNEYTFSQQKEILDVLLAEIMQKKETITIIAHDIGGPPAILWAHQNQARVQRLILLNTVLFPFSTPLDKISHTLFRLPIIKAIVASPFGLNLVMQTISKKRNKTTWNNYKQILSQNQHIPNKVKLKTILYPLEQAKKNEFLNLADLYKTLDIDRYIILAKHDPLCFAHIKKLTEENPEVPHYLIENCGHFIPLEKPDELNVQLKSILI